MKSLRAAKLPKRHRAAVWYPFATGRLARWAQVEKLLVYMREKGGVWFAPMEEIVRHIQTCRASGQYSPRIDKLP